MADVCKHINLYPTTLYYTPLDYTTLNYTTLHYPTILSLHCTTLHPPQEDRQGVTELGEILTAHFSEAFLSELSMHLVSECFLLREKDMQTWAEEPGVCM
jgi:hypothetical protein